MEMMIQTNMTGLTHRSFLHQHQNTVFAPSREEAEGTRAMSELLEVQSTKRKRQMKTSMAEVL